MKSAERCDVLRVLSYNIHTGIASEALRNYVTKSWQYLLPTQKRLPNLDNIAKLLRHYDIVALQEVDAGSLRTQFVNQVEYLAHQGGFPYWHCQLNRNLGRLAQHSNGLLSHLPISAIEGHALPGRIPGRGAIVATLHYHGQELIIINVHLALGATARRLQLQYLEEIIQKNTYVIVLGDFNCLPHHAALTQTFVKLGLCCVTAEIPTYPSWQPRRALDHIWISPGLRGKKPQIKLYLYSDHLPISAQIQLQKSK